MTREVHGSYVVERCPVHSVFRKNVPQRIRTLSRGLDCVQVINVTGENSMLKSNCSERHSLASKKSFYQQSYIDRLCHSHEVAFDTK